MKKCTLRNLLLTIAMTFALLFPFSASAQEMTVKPAGDGSIVDMSGTDYYAYQTRFASVSKSPVGDTLLFRYEVSSKWPSVDFLPPAGKTWDLSGYDGVEIKITNKSDQAVKMFAYVAGPGDTSGNKKRAGSKAVIGAGSTITHQVPFDPVEGPFNPADVASIRLFVGNLSAAVTFEIHSVKAFKYQF